VGWLLERLAQRRPLRILAGGNDWLAPDGAEWSRDRFFLGGYPLYHTGVQGHVEGALYQTERWWNDGGPIVPGYRIPLPPGAYRVTLHFLEGWHRTQGQRVFEVLLEGATLDGLEEYDPVRDAGYAVPHPHSAEVDVLDGTLDIEFGRRRNLPKINAIDIVPAGPPRRGLPHGG
jgi:hypothetical protein